MTMPRDPLRYFRIEAREIADQLGQGVLDLEKGAEPFETVARLLRLAHTLKGAARVVKQGDIAALAHRIEDLLSPSRDGTTPVGRATIDELLRAVDGVAAQLATLAPPPDSVRPASAMASEDLFRALRPDVHELEGLVDAIAETHRHVTALVPVLDRLERGRHLADLVVDQLMAPRGADGRPAEAHPAHAFAEDLRGLVAGIARDARERAEQARGQVREARLAAERLRLVPVRALFPLLERTARDSAASVQKRVRFAGVGGEVRVDAQVLTAVQAALIQVVRNAVAHGIEPVAERLAAGKSAEGAITLEVRHRGPWILFACRDDGGGVDLDRVRELARQKGLIAAADAAADPKALVDLLLRGGLSTAQTVTDMSGRGVGLDVVRETAARLRGDASMHSDRGVGTRVELVVPLTLAAVRALQVEAGGVTAFVPLDAVHGSLRLTSRDVVRTPRGHAVPHDGRSIPLSRLSQALAPGPAAVVSNEAFSVLVLRGRAGAAAFIVDRVIGTAEVVVQPLPGLVPASPLVAGVTLDDEGLPHPVLDPEALIAQAEEAPKAVDETPPRRAPVLVVDDSLTTRMLEQSILESAGYQVEVATSGEEALEKARTTQYALFLVDVEMPGMDGFSFVERIRREPDLRDTPAILVTSRNSPADVQRGLEVGARGYIVKSQFDQRVLLDHIRGLVG